MKQRFIVPGEPKGKGRPRTTMYGSRPRTPEDTLIYENAIGWEYRRQCKGVRFSECAMIQMEITAYYGIAKSKSKKQKALMERGILRPIKKPDIDNVVKVFADALNEIAYHDDTQIVELICNKYYSYEPRVEVVLRSLEGAELNEDREE